MIKALVYKSTGSWYKLETQQGQTFDARIKGVLKIDGITSTNPIAVGDWVNIVIEDEAANVATIVSIDDRENYVARQSPHNKHQHHIIAANIDQSLLFTTIKNPKTSQGFIDRFLVGCEMHHVPAIIVCNKADIYGKKEMEQYQQWYDMYTAIGYKLLLISLSTKTGLEQLQQILANKTTLLSGHSGTGKSSFINYLFPDKEIKTTEVSQWSGKGLHTTTFAQMYNLPFGGKIIDTPGIREFGLTNIEKQELSGYFPEMKAQIQQCKFNNCLHIEEPGCAVKQAIGAGLIQFDRYQSYYNILESIKTTW